MPGTRCAVAICNNYETSKKNGLNISFYTFPRDKKVRINWVKACHRGDMWNPKTSTICSVHFVDDDFEEDLKAQLLNTKIKQKLKPTAIPTKLLKKGSEDDCSVAKDLRDARAEERSQKGLVEDVLQDSQKPLFSPLQDLEYHTPEETLQKKYEDLIRDHESLKKKYKDLQEMNTKHKILLENQELHTAHIQNKLKEATASSESAHIVLQKAFSKAQIDLLTGNKKKVSWSNDDIAKAFALRYLGKRSYIFLRNNLKYPVPHLNTLQKWVSKLRFMPGAVMENILLFMKVAGLNMKSFEKVAVIVFDEVKVETTYEYDKANDNIIGPYSQMQVVMVRGLFSQWKQPIYFDFDQKITVEILNKIISKLHKIDFNVVACVADCGGGNVGLWRDLDISVEKSYFPHPITGENIFFFPDVPHLLKLVRNWLIDTGFILSDGSIVSKQPIYDLLQLTNKELSECFRLTRKHVECEKTERQNVALAAQLLSHTVFTALKHYQPGEKKKLAIDTANFIGTVSKWFEIMNSYSPTENLCTKKPYGMNLEEQNSCLDEMYHMVLSMRCVGKNCLEAFQKGILISITSIKLLLQEMKTRYSCSYILTRRVNQDCLEIFFSQLRSKDGLNDHPSPLTSIYRIRMIVLGKNPGALQNNVNTLSKEAPQTEYLVAHVFKSAGVEVDPIIDQDSEVPLSHCTSSSSDSSETSLEVSVTASDEDNGLIWLCGWIARKFREKYPYMDKYTKDIPVNSDHIYGIPRTWTQHVSFGGLTEPSEEWISQARQMEKVFNKFNKHKFGSHKNLLKKLIAIVKRKVTDVPEDVVKAFMLQRIYIRIKKLNNDSTLTKIQRKRKRDVEGKEARKLGNKMRKILSLFSPE